MRSWIYVYISIHICHTYHTYADTGLETGDIAFFLSLSLSRYLSLALSLSRVRALSLSLSLPNRSRIAASLPQSLIVIKQLLLLLLHTLPILVSSPLHDSALHSHRASSYGCVDRTIHLWLPRHLKCEWRSSEYDEFQRISEPPEMVNQCGFV